MSSLACTQLDFSTIKQLKTPCLGDGAPHSGLGLPTLIIFIKAVPHRYTPIPFQFIQSFIGTLLPGDYRLYLLKVEN